VGENTRIRVGSSEGLACTRIWVNTNKKGGAGMPLPAESDLELHIFVHAISIFNRRLKLLEYGH